MYYDPSGYSNEPNCFEIKFAKGSELQYQLKEQDLDWRGTDKTYRDAVEEAFKQTGIPKE